jgi:hypothetical protein
MTKKQQAYARRDAWTAALKDERVVRHEDGRLVSYPTTAACDTALFEAQSAGLWASVVREPAQ